MINTPGDHEGRSPVEKAWRNGGGGGSARSHPHWLQQHICMPRSQAPVLEWLLSTFDYIPPRWRNVERISIHYEVTLVNIYLFEHLSHHQHRQHCHLLAQEEIAAASFDVNFKEELSAINNSQMETKFTNMNLQVVRIHVQHAQFPLRTHLQHQRESPVASIRLELLLPSPESANSVGNPSDAAATLAQRRAKFKPTDSIVYQHRLSPQAQQNGVHGPASAHSAESSRSAITRPHKILIFPLSLGLPVTEHRLGAIPLSALPTPLAPVLLFPPPWATAGQTLDLATAKLNHLFGGGSVPRLGRPEKFRWSSKGHMHDSSSSTVARPTTVYAATTVTPSPASSHQTVGRVPSASSRGGSRSLPGGSNSCTKSHTLEHLWPFWRRQRRQQRDGRRTPTLAGLSDVHIQHEYARHGESQRNGYIARATAARSAIVPAGGGSCQLGLPSLGAGLGAFRGLQRHQNNGLYGGPCRQRQRKEKDKEDFDPAVLNDVAGWLHTLRLHKYTPNFEGISRKEMAVVDDQALEAQGVAALVARRKMLKMFEVVKRKLVIDGPTAPPPPLPPSGVPLPSSASTLVVECPRREI
ncbi:hypothetical protein V8E53_011545 [Lactarius tabidus]